ncbi:LOW QUALITY PROTEIN: uncharacterized protein LOC125226061 [Leguminivora glycinivorella]|uniref:LOW QUALITY PROTEIN: uncharacterized protein LOC125226061 n=1 Tax=Leguminivora glycinivorella TaxID=1035111 RepID=UPI00200E74A1|nr:LOW QUALITY PROTEIN: uncharacterized protein LOC125226061 [Leguminivora glycinivorella]
MVVGENKRSNIMDGIENTGDVRLHDHRLRLKQRFDIVRKLGQGTYGKVQLGINKKTGQEVAIKTIKKCKIESEADLVRIRREVQIMSSVRHPNIVHIYEVFENSEKMILVMEYCSGGELYDYLSQKKVLQEDEARRLFRQIATAVYYCHIHKICHRDLKLENVLLDDTGSAKIADFGLSNVFKETSLLSTFCGSPLYASPEIVKGTPYIGPEVDCWSLGVLLYTLVYGAMPFDGSNFKRLVRQISNGDYYEPKTPSTASPLIRDMLTVDPLKRADIVYICDHSWVNSGCETGCLEMAEMLAAETPVRLDLLLSLAPPPSNSVLVPNEGELTASESGAELTTSASMAMVEPSSSAEKRILDLMAEGGEDAIKPSPTRTIVADNKRKLELAASAAAVGRKKERVHSSASLAGAAAEPASEPSTPEAVQPTLKSSATMTISPAPAPAPAELAKDATKEIVKQPPGRTENPRQEAREEEVLRTGGLSRVSRRGRVGGGGAHGGAGRGGAGAGAGAGAAAAGAAQAPAQPKPKKFSIPGGNVGSFKEQFERRASLTTAPEPKRTVTKPVSKIAKPKAQSEDRELQKSPDSGSVRLQQIGIEPSPAPVEEMNRGGVKKTESEPNHGTPVDASVLLQDARRSLQNSMAKLEEAKVGEESRRRAARDIISSAIRTGKPPVPYGRSSSAGVAALSALASPPATPSAPGTPRLFRTEAQHRVEDHRPRGVSVERIIPIAVAEESPLPAPAPATAPAPAAAPAPAPAVSRQTSHQPLRRLTSNESTGSAAESVSSGGEPIKKSAREFIIPIAVEGKGYVTPRQRSTEPEMTRKPRKPRRISSLVSGGESEEEDDTHMHRLRSTRAARAESVSSGEEDEEDEGFHLLTAENLFSTLLHRVRALTNRLNGEEGPGFQRPHSLFNNLHHDNFFNSPHLPRRNLLREGWGSRDLHADFESMFNKPRQPPRGNSKKTGKQGSENSQDEALDLSDLDLSRMQLSGRELRALSGLTPALSRRLQRQLLAQLPPAAAQQLRRTLSLNAPSSAPSAAAAGPARSSSATRSDRDTSADDVDAAPVACATLPRLRRPSAEPEQTPQPPRDSSARATPDRPLLSKYLTPERALSLDESSDGGSVLSEPLARRHSMRLTPDRPRKRVSRFLRPDFFDTPPDESVYARQKREKEMETQKILREIREKKSRALESGVRSPEYGTVSPVFREEPVLARKCVSPGILLAKERSRSNTPFYPILDNIKEASLDNHRLPELAPVTGDRKTYIDSILDSKLTRPKSFPVKNLEPFDESSTMPTAEPPGKEESKEKTLPRESKLIRPKSYPTSSPSPEKVYINRTSKTDETVNNTSNPVKEETLPPPLNSKNDVEVSFSISLPKKAKPVAPVKTENSNDPILIKEQAPDVKDSPTTNLVLKKFVVVNNESEKTDSKDHKIENGIANGNLNGHAVKVEPKTDAKPKVVNSASKKEITQKSLETEGTEKKGTIKKKIIKKVSSKSKTDVGNADSKDKPATEKKKVTKKVKEKDSENGAKSTVTKKKSVLQSIGHKLEKFTSSKSNSPEKGCETKTVSEPKKETGRLSRTQREHSVPAGSEPPTESGLIKRAVTLTDVAALHPPQPSRTTVSKVLGLFKKFEPKDKVVKPLEKTLNDPEPTKEIIPESEPVHEPTDDKPKRPTSLLLNGLGRKKYGKSASDSVSVTNENNEHTVLKKDTESKSKNSLKLDFSRLPRVKKIVPTDPVIEPQIVTVSPVGKEIEKEVESNGTCEPDGDATMRSRSRSRSAFSGSEPRTEPAHPLRNHEPTTPEREDIVDRIRRKSFYSRFNEKKQRRKSNLVGPGATEYDPIAVLHGTERSDPGSPGSLDLSPGFSAASDLSPSAERYRSLLTDTPISTRNNLRFDNYGLNDKIDTYRSLDRNEFRKYPTRSYLDYEQGSYGGLSHRYARTASLLEGAGAGAEAREPARYSRTLSMYSPGNYATYRPKRTRNSAIILKETEKEPSPDNILDRIRQRKNYSISVTRKPDLEKEPSPRSAVPPEGEGDGAERATEAH